MREAHLRDAVALLEYFYWLERDIFGGKDVGTESTPFISEVDEVTAADRLESLRAEQARFVGLSFPTISSSGPNGAIIHYKPDYKTARRLRSDELYLCDSGAQYIDGTTDVTRTLHFGQPSEHQRRCFTRVLQGHIAVATSVMPIGTEGYKLDPMARAPLWADGLDYRHGTGHGVGASLNVHEGPQGMGMVPRSAYKGGLQPGMTLTDEPGYYEHGNFGIRIESCLVVKEAATRHRFGDKQFIAFENLTWVPIQRRMVDKSLLSSEERMWLNEYHQMTREKLTPILKAQGKPSALIDYLEESTKPV